MGKKEASEVENIAPSAEVVVAIVAAIVAVIVAVIVAAAVVIVA